MVVQKIVLSIKLAAGIVCYDWIGEPEFCRHLFEKKSYMSMGFIELKFFPVLPPPLAPYSIESGKIFTYF